jgi:hypothetical protein
VTLAVSHRRCGRVLDEVEDLAWSDLAPIADAIGSPEQKFRAFEQLFGANRQVPHVGGCDNGGDSGAANGAAVSKPVGRAKSQISRVISDTTALVPKQLSRTSRHFQTAKGNSKIWPILR